MSFEQGTRTRAWKKAFLTSQGAASYPSRIPTVKEPSYDGVVDLRAQDWASGATPVQVMILPYGTGSNDDAFVMRLLGWRRIGTPEGVNTPVTVLWVPTPFGEFTCTLGAAVGVAGAAILNTEAFADTIVPVTGKLPDGTGGAGTALVSEIYVETPADDTIAWLTTPLRGFEKIEFCFKYSVNTPAGNALYATFSK
jgi:hypothetical protein